MSTQPPKSDDLKGTTIPFPVAPAKKSNDSVPTGDRGNDPISEGKGRLLIMRRRRKRRTRPYAISVLPIHKLYEKYLREEGDQDK